MVTLPENPLSITHLKSGSSTRLLVSIALSSNVDADGAHTEDLSSLRILELRPMTGWQLSDLPFANGEGSASDELDVNTGELLKALYSTETLRKTDRDDMHSTKETETEVSSVTGDE